MYHNLSGCYVSSVLCVSTSFWPNILHKIQFDDGLNCELDNIFNLIGLSAISNFMWYNWAEIVVNVGALKAMRFCKFHFIVV